MKEGLKEKFLRGFSCAIVIIILIGGGIFAWPSYQRHQAAKQKAQEITVRIEEKKAEIESYKKKQVRFRTDRDFVEAIARQNNRVFPGELVFIFEKE